MSSTLARARANVEAGHPLTATQQKALHAAAIAAVVRLRHEDPEGYAQLIAVLKEIAHADV